MKKTYAFVVNERADDTIGRAVKDIFEDYGSSIPLDIFRARLALRLKQTATLVELVSLEKTPLQYVEKRYGATAYRMIDGIIYKNNPEKP